MKTHHGMMLGNLVMTQGVNAKFESDIAFEVHLKLSFERYLSHDWGDCGEEDTASNDAAALGEDRIVAAYEMAGHPDNKIWIITECDRSLTTFLFLSLSMIILAKGKRPIFIALISALMALGGWAVFIWAFDTRFPRGWFENTMKAVLANG